MENVQSFFDRNSINRSINRWNRKSSKTSKWKNPSK